MHKTPRQGVGAGRIGRPKSNKTHEIEETYAGYIIRPRGGAPLSIVIPQMIAGFLGSIFAMLSLFSLMLPSNVAVTDVLAIKIAAALVMAVLGGLLLWYATRGTAVQVHVDKRMEEVREVITNRTGRNTIIANYGFDAIGGVHLDRSKSCDGQAVLVMRRRNSSVTVPVTAGSEEDLIELRDRMGRDLLLSGTREHRRNDLRMQAQNSTKMPLVA